MSKAEWKKNISSSSIWIRGFFMILYIAVAYVVRLLILVISLFQFGYTIFIGIPNEKLVKLGDGLRSYAYQIIQFLTFNTELKPYPFAEWGEINSPSQYIPEGKD